MHKWWARRLSSNFRMLLLGATSHRGVNGNTLWREFYQRQDLKDLVVLDPFMGGGTSIVEATKMGARTVGSDIDPVAWFVTKKEVEPFDRESFAKALARLEETVGKDVEHYYRTTLDDGRAAVVTNFFWVAMLDCSECRRSIELHPHYVLWHEKKRETTKKTTKKTTRKQRAPSKIVFCSHCHAIHQVAGRAATLNCACGKRTSINKGTTKGGQYFCACGHTGKLLDHVAPGRPLPTKLFAFEWEIDHGSRVTNQRGFARATSKDHETFARASAELSSKWNELPIPKHEIPTKDRRDNRPVNYGYAYYHQLFNDRQKLVLGRILAEIRKIADEPTREYMLLAFSDSLASNNMLCPYAFGYRKLTPLFGLHAYRMITRPVEGNTWGAFYGRGSFKKCVEKVVRGKEYCADPYEYWGPRKETRSTQEKIEAATTANAESWRQGSARALLLNQSSTQLTALKDGEVDLILTDPPYYNNLPYSEMSDFFFAWIREDLPKGASWRETSTPYRESLFVQRNTEEQYRQYANGMRDVFRECKRVLNPDGIMVFTYHHLDPRAWLALGQALNEANLIVTHSFPLLAEGKSGFHSTEGNIKWDAVFCCRPARAPANPGGSKWTTSWKQTVRAQLKTASKGITLGQADKRSFAMALTVAQATVSPLPEGEMFLLLRDIGNEFATKRLKFKATGHVRPHKTRTAQWFIKGGDEPKRKAPRRRTKKGT